MKSVTHKNKRLIGVKIGKYEFSFNFLNSNWHRVLLDHMGQPGRCVRGLECSKVDWAKNWKVYIRKIL